MNPGLNYQPGSMIRGINRTAPEETAAFRSLKMTPKSDCKADTCKRLTMLAGSNLEYGFYGFILKLGNLTE